MNPRPFLIGIAGPSCSGKTTLARAVAKGLAAQNPGGGPIVVLPQDAYYADLAALPLDERAKHNFDEPAAFDWTLMESQLHDLAAGRAVERPLYDFATHTSRKETQTIPPGSFVIFEGILALHSATVRKLLTLSVFVDAPDEVCLERRILRDTQSRGRTRESVQLQFRETVQPMAECYVRPMRAFADIVVDGEANIDVGVNDVLTAVSSKN